MKVNDNFLPEDLFQELQDYCNQKEFQEIKVGDKSFLYLPTPEVFIPLLQIPEHQIILSFIRKAHSEFDTDYRIHSDRIINQEQTELACVVYINENEGVTTNGTAFWKHHFYGSELPKESTNEEFNRLLLEDSNDLSKWKLIRFVQSQPNRCLTYKANQFHSKYPNKITEGERIVMVTFYKK